jgi:CHAT domain-containing protein
MWGLRTPLFNDRVSSMGRWEGFKKAQLEVKAHYPEPYYWGVFVMVGE